MALFDQGNICLILVDEHSQYPIVEIVRSSSANTVIPVLDKMFSMFGIPQILKTDNGPPLSGSQITDFAQYSGFSHRKITPLWPGSNAERFMRVLGKTLKASNIQGRPWKQVLNDMLRNYRATPHSKTGTSPSSLLFGREFQGKERNMDLDQFDHRNRLRNNPSYEILKEIIEYL